MAITLDGTTGLTLPGANTSAQLGSLTFMNSQATTSGTSVDFTNIPSWVKRITVMLNDVSSTTLAGFFYVRLGAGSIATTGYNGINGTISTVNNTTAGTVHTTGIFAGSTGGTATTSNVSSIVIINKYSDSSNLWVAQCSGFRTNDGTSFYAGGYGKIELSGTLDRLSVITTVGTFDAGTVNIMYE